MAICGRLCMCSMPACVQIGQHLLTRMGLNAYFLIVICVIWIWQVAACRWPTSSCSLSGFIAIVDYSDSCSLSVCSSPFGCHLGQCLDANPTMIAKKQHFGNLVRDNQRMTYLTLFGISRPSDRQHWDILYGLLCACVWMFVQSVGTHSRMTCANLRMRGMPRGKSWGAY